MKPINMVYYCRCVQHGPQYYKHNIGLGECWVDLWPLLQQAMWVLASSVHQGLWDQLRPTSILTSSRMTMTLSQWSTLPRLLGATPSWCCLLTRYIMLLAPLLGVPCLSSEDYGLVIASPKGDACFVHRSSSFIKTCDSRSLLYLVLSVNGKNLWVEWGEGSVWYLFCRRVKTRDWGLCVR